MRRASDSRRSVLDAFEAPKLASLRDSWGRRDGPLHRRSAALHGIGQRCAIETRPGGALGAGQSETNTAEKAARTILTYHGYGRSIVVRVKSANKVQTFILILSTSPDPLLTPITRATVALGMLASLEQKRQAVTALTALSMLRFDGSMITSKTRSTL